MDFSAMASLIEMLFVQGIVVGIGLWQLVSIRREIRKGREARAVADSAESQLAEAQNGADSAPPRPPKSVTSSPSRTQVMPSAATPSV